MDSRLRITGMTRAAIVWIGSLAQLTNQQAGLSLGTNGFAAPNLSQTYGPLRLLTPGPHPQACPLQVPDVVARLVRSRPVWDLPVPRARRLRACAGSLTARRAWPYRRPRCGLPPSSTASAQSPQVRGIVLAAQYSARTFPGQRFVVAVARARLPAGEGRCSITV